MKKSGEELTFENFKSIKKFLISIQTGNFYKNPVVIISGVNKGETIEDNNKIVGYKNNVIKNIIGDIRELLEDDFFKFEAVKSDEIISNNNDNNENNNIVANNSDLNIIRFEEV